MQTSKPNSLTPRTLLAFVFTLIFFSSLPLYLYTFPYQELKATYWKVMFGLAIIVICLPETMAGGKKLTVLSTPLFKWLILYFAVTVIWFIPTNQSEVLERLFKDEISGILFIFMSLLLFTGHKKAQTAARYAVLAAVFFSVACNIMEFFDPFLFTPSYSLFSNPGRSAGLYVNANQSGAALVLGMILTAGLLPKRYRLPYVAFVFLGVALTFSRSAIMGWVIVVIAFTIARVLTKKELLVCAIGLVSLVSAATAISFYVHAYKPDFNEGNLVGRIDWFTETRVDDDSISQRKLVAAMAWDQFTESPLTGNGLGSTMQWSETASTHNMYLTFMSDFGIIGIFVYPLLVLAVIWKARGEAWQTAVPFAVFILWQGFFSHNIVQENYFLVAFALMASMSLDSRRLDERNVITAPDMIQRAKGAYR